MKPENPGRKQHRAEPVISKDDTNVATHPGPIPHPRGLPQPGAQDLLINLFFSGPFPVPVPTCWSTTLPADHELELRQLGCMVFGPRWKLFAGTLVLEQRSRLQRVGGPLYWVPAGRLDPCVRCVRVGDDTTVRGAGWRVVGGEVWLLVRYVPTKRMKPECGVDVIVGSTEAAAGDRAGRHDGVSGLETSAVGELRSLKRRRTLEAGFEDPGTEALGLDVRGPHVSSTRVLRSSQRRRKI